MQKTDFIQQLTKFSYINYDVNLSRFTTLKIGGNAWAMAEPRSKEELIEIHGFCMAYGIPFYIMGFGSCVVADDRGFKGLIINTRKLEHTPILVEKSILQVSCGQYFPRLVMYCQKLGLSGLEWGIGIPGTLGGAVWMNAGAGGSSISSTIENITVWDGYKEFELSRDDVRWGYRYSEFQNNPSVLILGAQLKLVQSSEGQVEKVIEERLKTIKDTQPRTYPSVGTVFIKGRGYLSTGIQVGGVMCSEKNPSWIININNGTSRDMYKIIQKVIYRHIWRGYSPPKIEPIFIPYDIKKDRSHTIKFNHASQIYRHLTTIGKVRRKLMSAIFKG